MAERSDRQADYSAAVYGSLLAGSVVAGAGQGRDLTPPLTLMALLLATGLVFWLAHAYARLVGDRIRDGMRGWAELRGIARAEAPLATAAVPPAAMAAVGWLAGLSDSTTAWLCLLVAVAEQVGWAMIAALRNGSSRRFAAASAIVNLGLGLIIIALKAGLAH